jgi:signal transduction histidine kinase
LEPASTARTTDLEATALDSERIEAELLFDLLRRARPILVSGVALIVVFVAIFWEMVPRRDLMVWAALGLFLTLMRLGMAYRFQSRPRDPSERRLWRNAIAISAACGGALWGAASVFLHEFDPERHRFTIALFVIALSGAAVVGYANSLAAFYAFIVPALLPYGAALSISGGRFSPWTAGIFLLSLGLVCSYARCQNQAAGRAIALRLSVEHLIERLAQSRDKAEAASTAKSRFLAHMSHELRTPLNAIIGFSEMMVRNLFGPIGNSRYADYAQSIHRSGTHLLRLVDEILDVTKLEAGKLELARDPIDIAALVAESIAFVRPSAARGGIRIEVEMPPGLPQISADPLKTKQVLINLLSNAVKFTPKDGLVRITARPQVNGLDVDVADTGVGMSAQDIELAVIPFSRLESREHTVRLRSSKGDAPSSSTGLGLPLSTMIMEKQGGALTIESQVGRGTTVTIRFPAARLLPVAANEAPAGADPLAGANPDCARAGGKTKAVA